MKKFLWARGETRPSVRNVYKNAAGGSNSHSHIIQLLATKWEQMRTKLLSDRLSAVWSDLLLWWLCWAPLVKKKLPHLSNTGCCSTRDWFCSPERKRKRKKKDFLLVSEARLLNPVLVSDWMDSGFLIKMVKTLQRCNDMIQKTIKLQCINGLFVTLVSHPLIPSAPTS